MGSKPKGAHSKNTVIEAGSEQSELHRRACGINPALIAIILGVDRILDMCRTVLNVTGDLTAATYVARSEGFKLLGRKA